MTGPVLTDASHGVARITLNRPERKNAIDVATWRELERALSWLQETEARVLILRAAGFDFSAGADISGDDGDGNEGFLERMRWIHGIVLRLHQLAIPTIAEVDGLAIGIGMNLALACDLTVATDRARFSEIFIKRALSVDGGGSWLLPRLVGIQRAKTICLLGEFLTAQEALDLGLIAEMTTPDELGARTAALAAELVTRPPQALARTKQLLNQALSGSFNEALEREAQAQVANVGGDEFTAAMAAFRSRAARETASSETGP